MVVLYSWSGVRDIPWSRVRVRVRLWFSHVVELCWIQFLLIQVPRNCNCHLLPEGPIIKTQPKPS